MNRNRRGFTIVEMLMVIAVLAVLTGIITTAASAAIRQARTRRAEAMRMVIEGGIATFHAQRGYWPPNGGKLQKWSDNGLDRKGDHVAYLDDGDYDEMMTYLVKQCVDRSASPVMDVSGLTVATKSAASNRDRGFGQDFRSAVAKNKRHGKTLKVSEMAFGYSTSKEGLFRRYVVKYNADSDSVAVMTQDQYRSATGKTWPDKP